MLLNGSDTEILGDMTIPRWHACEWQDSSLCLLANVGVPERPRGHSLAESHPLRSFVLPSAAVGWALEVSTTDR